MARPAYSSDVVSSRFNGLLKELLAGEIKRNSFLPWEVDILLDIEGCPVRNSLRRQLLRRYQKAVNRELERGAAAPSKFSEYIQRNVTRARRPAVRMVS
jgi:hypothetical protein